MRLTRLIYLTMAALLISVTAMAQELPTDESAPLVLVQIIPIPGVLGRFDHMGVDNDRGRVFAAIYGNDSVEVIDPRAGFECEAFKRGLSSHRWSFTCLM
jgi:hypothetical protein